MDKKYKIILFVIGVIIMFSFEYYFKVNYSNIKITASILNTVLMLIVGLMELYGVFLFGIIITFMARGKSSEISDSMTIILILILILAIIDNVAHSANLYHYVEFYKSF